MQPKIVDLPERHMVGMGARFISALSPDRNNFEIIPPLWDRFLERLPEIPGRFGSPVAYGLCFPIVDAADRQHPDECFYMAASEVKSISEVPAGMVARTVPAGRFAVFTHRGTIDKLGLTMSYIYGSWLARSGQRLREAPDLEVYDQRFDPGSAESELDICIPIQT